MKLVAPLAISVLVLTACAPDPNNPQNRTLTGALTGAAVGGVIGAATGDGGGERAVAGPCLAARPGP